MSIEPDDGRAFIRNYDPRHYAIARCAIWITSEAIDGAVIDLLRESYNNLRHKVENEIRESNATPVSGGLLRLVYEQEVQTDEPLR